MINENTILGMIMSLVFITILFKVLPKLLPGAITSISDLFHNLSEMGTSIGTDAAAFAGEVPDLTGWFWIVAIFALVVVVILSLFHSRR